MTFVYQIPSRLLFYKDRGKKTLTINPILNASDPNAGKYISSNFTKQGSPTVTSDGIASGFSSNHVLTNYLRWAPGDSSWEIRVKFTTPSVLNATEMVYGPSTATDHLIPRIGIQANGKWILSIPNADGSAWQYEAWGTSSITPQVSTTYTAKVYYTGTQYKLDVSTDGSTWTNIYTKDSVVPVVNSNTGIVVGGDLVVTNYYWGGSVDLKSLVVSVDGTQVFRGSYPTPDPSETVVTLTSAGKTITSKTGSYIKNSNVTYNVSHPYFTSASGSTRMDKSKTIPVTIDEYAWYTLTINPSQSGSTITFASSDGYQSGSNTFRVHDGSTITYKVEKTGYVTVTDSIVLTEDTTIDITQSLSWMMYTGDSYTGEQSTDANYDLGLDS